MCVSEYFPLCLSAPRTLCETLLLNHGITKDILTSSGCKGFMEALCGFWINKHVFLRGESTYFLFKDTFLDFFLPLKCSLVVTQCWATNHAKQCSYVQQLFIFYFLYLFTLAIEISILKPIYKILHKSDVVIEWCFIIFADVLLDCNAAYVHSHWATFPLALVHEYVGFKLTCTELWTFVTFDTVLFLTMH